MDQTLTVEERVVTAEVLGRLHQGQALLRLSPGSVLTPSGWDYVNQHHLEVVRGAAPPVLPGPPEELDTRPAPVPEISEVLPSVAEDTRIVQEGRCDHPDRACGCESEEFGSGFVESDDGRDSTVRRIQREGDAAPCDGPDRQDAARDSSGANDLDEETLVRLITEQVLARLKELG
jgi:hypothetical protein